MTGDLYAEVILPLAVRGTYHYRVPDRILSRVRSGSLVIVPFGKRKLYSAVVLSLAGEIPDRQDIKDICDIIDQFPAVGASQLDFWKWLSDYYMCTLGEVMKAALPSPFCLQSETIVNTDPRFSDFKNLDHSELKLFNLIENKCPVSAKKLPVDIDQKNTLKILNTLILKNAVYTGQAIEEKAMAREERYIILAKKYSEKELNEILNNLGKAPRQADLLSSYIRLTGYSGGTDLYPVKRDRLLKESGSTSSALNSLVRKNILLQVNFRSDHEKPQPQETFSLNRLSDHQSSVLATARAQLDERKIVLLKGVTSSGKTELYIHLIDEQVKQGRQVLYLLPEIALTSQITGRLRKYFGDCLAVYHSRIGEKEQAEIWKRTATGNDHRGYRIILGARSALFLPFSNLGLVIIDEEHDSSYKQHDPAPRYNARDSAVMLASLAGAGTVLGSATPSVETYNNAVTGKYGLAELKERFGRVNLPEIMLADTREAGKRKLMVSHFTPQLLHAIDEALARGEQAILFRNRRGFSQHVECSECGWIPVCSGCSVNLTYHKELNRLVCHYCGSSIPLMIK